MPQLRKRASMGRDVWEFLIGCLCFGRLEHIDGHYIWTPKSPKFERKVFHDFQEAEHYIMENRHEG